LFLNFLLFFCKAARNVGPYGLFWQPALVRYSSILYLCLLIGQIKMLACLLNLNDIKNIYVYFSEAALIVSSICLFYCHFLLFKNKKNKWF